MTRVQDPGMERFRDSGIQGTCVGRGQISHRRHSEQHGRSAFDSSMVRLESAWGVILSDTIALRESAAASDCTGEDQEASRVPLGNLMTWSLSPLQDTAADSAPNAL